jgi:hypothetical protein
MYEKLIQIKQEVLEAVLGLLDKETQNPLQCLVVWDGTHSIILILDEPPCSRMYVNGEWLIQDVERRTYEVFTISEDLSPYGDHDHTLTETVEAILTAQIQQLWGTRLDDFQRYARLMGPVLGVEITPDDVI